MFYTYLQILLFGEPVGVSMTRLLDLNNTLEGDGEKRTASATGGSGD